jgi:hypothetical protein
MNPPELDRDIKELFEKNMGKEWLQKYYAPNDFCPSVNFQSIQHWEKEQRKAGDPGGFCAAWSAWYADIRMANPDLSREYIVNYSVDLLYKKPESFTEFIRNYSAFIAKIGGRLENSPDPFETLRQLGDEFNG